jgi:hypothetical protein
MLKLLRSLGGDSDKHSPEYIVFQKKLSQFLKKEYDAGTMNLPKIKFCKERIEKIESDEEVRENKWGFDLEGMEIDEVYFC